MIAHLDCATGVSGDKFLGAVLDIGEATGAFTARHLQELLDALAPEGRTLVARSASHGITAVSVRIEVAGDRTSRRWNDIRTALRSAELNDRAREMALAAFSALAEVEAQVHGTTPDEVHFHEVGALDSIMDVVGTCVGLDALGIKRLTASPVATGWGSADTSHGVLTVPTPATALLLLGVPITPGRPRPDGSAPGELTTPTGAALLKTWAAEYGPSAPMTPRHVGYGMGTRDIGMPNVCRLIVGEPASTSPPLHAESVILLEANVDHISPEAVAFAAEELLAEGALDVWTIPVHMKKGRPGLVLSALVRTEDETVMAGRMSALTGSLGIRVHAQPRLVARRESFTMQTPWGAVQVKRGPVGEAPDVLRPEYEDVARIARHTRQPFLEVQAELARLARVHVSAELEGTSD